MGRAREEGQTLLRDIKAATKQRKYSENFNKGTAVNHQPKQCEQEETNLENNQAQNQRFAGRQRVFSLVGVAC